MLFGMFPTPRAGSTNILLMVRALECVLLDKIMLKYMTLSSQLVTYTGANMWVDIHLYYYMNWVNVYWGTLSDLSRLATGSIMNL